MTVATVGPCHSSADQLPAKKRAQNNEALRRKAMLLQQVIRELSQRAALLFSGHERANEAQLARREITKRIHAILGMSHLTIALVSGPEAKAE